MLEYDFQRSQFCKKYIESHGGRITKRPDHGSKATNRGFAETPASRKWVGIPKTELGVVIAEGVAEYFSTQSPKLS